MNMRDTILINKELLKRELQYLEKQTRNYTRKETAREIINEIKAFIYNNDNLMERINIIAKQYGVDLGE